MAKILLTLTGQSANVGSSQLFDDQEHFDTWVEEHKDNFFPNLVINGSNFTFDGGSGVIESKPDDYQN